MKNKLWVRHLIHNDILSPCGAETKLFIGNWVNNIAVDAMASDVTKPLAAPVLQDKRDVVFHEEDL